MMLGLTGHSSFKGGEVGCDAIDMEVNEGLLAFGAEEEGAVAGLSMKRFSTRTAGARVWRRR